MRGLLRSELLKITSTRVALALMAGCVGYVAGAGSASAIVLVAGILGMTSEYRYQTVTPTFLVTPRRGRVLTAKLVVHAAFGLVIGVVCAGFSAGLATALLTFKPHAPVSASTVVQISAGTVLG